MRWALSRGEVTFVEMGAGKVLSGLVKKLDRKAPTLATEDPEAMQKALSALSAEVPV
jgi:[acyl-carrier-protein] S-malonyltransferase